MKHYVCTGDCVEVSNKPGVCESEGCSKEGMSLVACHCDDEMHDEAFAHADTQQVSVAVSDTEEEGPSDDDLEMIEDEEDHESDDLEAMI